MSEKYDYLIVGSGLCGAVFAREAVKAGKKVLVVEKRSHIGGNIYTKEVAQEYFKFYIDKKGVLRCGNDFVNYNTYERQIPLGPKMLTLIAHWIGIGLNKRFY